MHKVLYEKLLEFFDEGWFVSTNEEEQFLKLIYNGKHSSGTWACYAQAADEDRVFIFYSVWPETIVPERRANMAELFTRINYGIKLGNFEMDFEDGEVRYKTSVMLEHNAWCPEVIRPVVYFNVGMMDKYWLTIQEVASSEIRPEIAIALSEE